MMKSNPEVNSQPIFDIGIERVDPFDDPVSFLASLGIEAELVSFEMDILVSAA